MLRRITRNPLPLVFKNWRRWSRFKRLFIQNMLIGVLIEAGILGLTALQVPFIVQLQNATLEAAMNWWADSPEERPGAPRVLFVDIDEETRRDPWWGGGEPRLIPREPLANIVDTLYAAGIHTVLLDFTIDALPAAANTELDAVLREADQRFATRIEQALAAHPDRHLIYPKTFRPALERNTAQAVRSSVLDPLIALFPAQVHPAAPNFLVSPDDGQVRYWRLWESACQETGPAPGSGRWVVIPSPQLILRALSVAPTTPDLPPWGLATPLSLATASCAVDGAGSDSKAQGENSARADFQAGRWIWKTFGKCYEQDRFTAEQCGDTVSFKKTTRMSGHSESAVGETLGNRVLYRYSDPRQNTAETGEHLRAANPAIMRLPAISLKGGTLEASAIAHRPLVAIVGASYLESGDWHLTPFGKMPGALVLANAIDTMQTVGLVQSPSLLIKLGSILLMLVIVSVLFAALPGFWAATLLFAGIAVVMIPLALLIVREQGIWLDVAVPVLGIYAYIQLGRVRDAVRRAQYSKGS